MRVSALLLVLSLFSFSALPARAETPEAEVRAAITAYQEALADRNIARVQKVVGADVVAIENGSRRQGWEEFRDRRLMPQFAHPAPPSRWEIVKLNATGDMAWAYTKTLLASSRKGDAVVWTVFVLARHGKEWKIVLLDQTSSRTAAETAKPRRH